MNLADSSLWDTPFFPVSVAANAAGIAPATLRQWIVRYGDDLSLWRPKDGIVVGEQAPRDGMAHKLTYRAVLHISAAARLVNKGVQVKDAYWAAASWAHLGSDHDSVEPTSVPSREPAGLFPDPAWTFLIHHDGPHAEVVAVERDNGRLPFSYADLFASGGPFYTPPTIVFLNMVERYARGVCEGFLAPNKVLADRKARLGEMRGA
jgi:hypothetical protein